MAVARIEYLDKNDVPREAILALYRAHGWSAAEKPDELMRALANSAALFTAWDGQKLVGLANAISDGHLVVYYPHFLVHPDYQRSGIGRRLVEMLRAWFDGLHQQMLVADPEAIGFYKKCGFEKAGKTQAMWIFEGKEHG